MLQHIIMFYKYGGKQLYYFNTADGAGEIEVNFQTTTQVDEEDCESCKL